MIVARHHGALLGPAYIPSLLLLSHQRHVSEMSKYTVRSSSSGVGFDIAVIGGDGARNTLLGFDTEMEAQRWIARDKRLNDRTDPFMPLLMMLRRDHDAKYPESSPGVKL